VANPPYVSEEEFAVLDPVLRYEPFGALVSPDADGVGGFADVASIIDGAAEWLAPRGALVLEHANTHREAVLAAARASGFSDVEDLDDMAGQPRVLVARR
jgi:release factor glutamine methyltransferase